MPANSATASNANVARCAIVRTFITKTASRAGGAIKRPPTKQAPTAALLHRAARRFVSCVMRNRYECQDKFSCGMKIYDFVHKRSRGTEWQWPELMGWLAPYRAKLQIRVPHVRGRSGGPKGRFLNAMPLRLEAAQETGEPHDFLEPLLQCLQIPAVQIREIQWRDIAAVDDHPVTEPHRLACRHFQSTALSLRIFDEVPKSPWVGGEWTVGTRMPARRITWIG